MLTLDSPTTPFSFRKTPAQRSGLHRLLTAAIVNSQFREKLLNEPETALAGGYLGQAFILTEQEKAIIKTVRAKDLTDFAQKVNQALKTV
ncbi:MAG: hypothetical protein C3F07_18240 [Anaerolineales bacterium]|nr:MAG: hypothetical protein C3F07_18240 [Anaerolineales bacterium]